MTAMRSWALVATVVLLAGCGGDSLEADDPAGYEACQLYSESQDSNDSVVRAGLPLFEVGDRASEAETEAIRDAVQPLFGDEMPEGTPTVWDVDGEALAAACEEAGFGAS